MRLIDADALKRNILCWENCYNGYSDAYDKSMIIGAIEEMPTVDTGRHGHWKYKPKDAFEVMFKLPKCSVCGHESSDALNYCSNCGALMDEVEE